MDELIKIATDPWSRNFKRLGNYSSTLQNGKILSSSTFTDAIFMALPLTEREKGAGCQNLLSLTFIFLYFSWLFPILHKGMLQISHQGS